jgi:hypothetical protein
MIKIPELNYQQRALWEVKAMLLVWPGKRIVQSAVRQLCAGVRPAMRRVG